MQQNLGLNVMILIENRRKQKTENILSFILGIEPTNSVTSVAALTIELQELLLVYVAKLKFSAVLCPINVIPRTRAFKVILPFM